MKSVRFIQELSREVKPTSKLKGGFYSELCRIFPLRRIESQGDYKSAIKMVTSLSEKIIKEGEEKTHEDVLVYADTLGLLIEHYEKNEFPEVGKKVSGVEMLAFLMEQNQLSQKHLAKHMGGQSVVSDILAGKRKLNAEHIRVLSEFFHVSPAVFFEY